MSKRLKRPLSKIRIAKRVLTISLCILLPVGVYIGYTKVKVFYEEKVEAMTKEMSGYNVTAYEAVKDIKAGEIITKEMVETKKTLSSQERESFITADDIGSQALVDIPKKTQLLKNMLQKNIIDDNLRELEFSLNLAGENIKEGDYTDIRLRYPDGEDYIVLSKIYISRIDGEKGYLYINLSPEEIHLISSALVDCYLKTGSYLYTTRYIAASYQEPSHVTYIPNMDVLKLIKKDPNVVEKARDYLKEMDRGDLEERLRQYYGQYSMSWEDSFTGSDNTTDNSRSNPLYYINGKESTSKQTTSGKQSTSENSVSPGVSIKDTTDSTSDSTAGGYKEKDVKAPLISTSEEESQEVEYAE